MSYDRLTIPNLTPVRCKETKYTQQEELNILRQRLYELETKIDNKSIIEVPGIIIIHLPVYDASNSDLKIQSAYQVVWYEDHGYLMSQIELDIDKAQKLLTKHLGGIYNND